jgi:hypothetical protein
MQLLRLLLSQFPDPYPKQPRDPDHPPRGSSSFRARRLAFQLLRARRNLNLNRIPQALREHRLIEEEDSKALGVVCDLAGELFAPH